MPMQVNITTKVNSQAIRRETYNGREHWVIPSYTLPFDVVMNGIMYPRDEILRTYQTLDGTLAPFGHPTLDGQFVSARSPEGINAGHIGAWNRNAKLTGNRVYMEKWLDVSVAQTTENGRRTLERLEAIEKGEDVPPIHTSVAAFIEQHEPPQGAEYQAVAKIHSFDHDAILLDEVGAATPEQGVGLMVNADQAVPIRVNSGVLVGESFREREARLDRAAKERFAAGADEYAWVADFTDSQAVVVRNGGVSEVYGYTSEGGKIIFDDMGTPVVRQESWVATVVNKLSKIKQFFNPQARPAANKEGDMPLTPEEKAELVTEIGANTNKSIDALAEKIIKPLAEKVDTLAANHKTLSDTLTANQRAEEADKRKAVAEKLGEVVANALQGEALDAAFKQIGEAAPIGSGLAGNRSDKPKFDEVPE